MLKSLAYTTILVSICLVKLVFASGSAQQCGKNEIPTSCIESVCELRNCSDIGKSYSCVRLDPCFCTSGCLCKEGYLRDDNGICIPVAQCPKLCGKNEIPTSCFESVCERRNCSEIGKPYSCVRLDPQFCTSGCLCKEGYLRDDNGVCVRISQCPKACGKNEIPTSCFEGICERRNCSDIGKPVRCVRPRVCTDGCLCKEGYLRDDNGKCIPIAQCPNIQCGTNEIFDECPPQCPGEGCSVDPSVTLCLPNLQPGDPGCNPGCRCQDNYFRNDDGCCVTRDECQVCGENEIPTSCFEAICERRSCSDLGNPVMCVRLDPSFCTNGCLCKEGYLRDDNGICIPIAQCPNIQCGTNEIFDTCPPECPGEGCRVDPSVTLCLPNPQPGDPGCTPGCRCQDNYFRNDDGCCVTRDECPVCGINEVYDTCIAPCPPRRCDVDETLIRCASPPQPGDPNCNAGCRCADNFYRNDSNVCVPRNECPEVCGENEIPTSCFEAICERRSCSDLENPVICIRLDPSFCTNGCLCKEGYLRDENGICIPIAQCPNIQCGTNEIFDACPPQCPGEGCRVDPSVIFCLPNPQPGDPSCNPGCRCQDNYYRNDDGCCVTRDECPVCGINEVYDTCIAPCPPRRCDVDERLLDCASPPQPGDPDCNAGCRCADNFYRNDNNVCVPRNECPEVCGENEIPTSCFEGICERRSCSDLGKPVICIRLDPSFCTNGCLCKEGYLRDDNGKCIPIAQCPNIQCGTNEIFDACPPQCPGEDCRVDPTLILCLPNPQPGDPRCNPGCRCQDNYFRDDAGCCVTRDECPNPPTAICSPDEVPTDCVNGGCGIWYCSQTQEICNLMLDEDCEPGCLCRDGLLRAENGTCIPADQCPPKCNGPNEYFSCGSACDNVCATLSTQNQTNCPIVNKKCNPKCYCQERYARDSNSICIPIEDCPPPICGINEVYDTCIAPCPPRRCDVDERVIRCASPPQPGDPNCNAGCRCADNFYRNDRNVCVPRNECPGEQPIICGPDEIYNSCINGGCDRRNCSQPEYTCVLVGEEGCRAGCQCRDGLLRADDGTCIPADQCPPLCGINEIYDTCPASCPPRTCATLGIAFNCITPLQPGDVGCKPSCRCIDGYYRNRDGVCIPKNECPKPVICGADEVYSSCVNGGCGRWNCSQPASICINLIEGACREGCRCKEDLLRTDDGICVPADQCPINCFGQNEIRGCRLNCPPQTCESIGKKYRCPPQTKECRIDCRCKEGFFRNKIGECIAKEDCLKCTGPNEYFSCGGACDNVCATLATQNQTNCPIVNIVCNPKCYCEQGYARDSNNTCVLISKCPQPVCGKNEVFDVCPASCPPRTCDALGRAYKCEAPPTPGDPECEPSCRCADGYYRNEQGACVSESECLNCFGQNEVIGCQSSCPPQTCESIGKVYPCPLQPAVCRPECRCKTDFFRNKIGECISKEDCLKCTGPNEYFSCGGACDNVCATLATQNQTNCPIINVVCNPKCYCEQGYARDSNNTCVLISQCPQPICGQNEVFDECPATCPPRTCVALGRAYKCRAPPKPGDPECKPSCRCADGYYRNKQGLCVPENECLTCLGQNEIIGCQSNCPPQTCESIGKQYDCPLQPAVCKPECRCKKGFFRNKIGQCISKKNCLKCTGPNEYFSCGGACDNVCATLATQNQTNCPIVNVVCNPKCYCEQGYARDSNNSCVLISQCPQPICGKNEVFDECPATCPPRTCVALGRAYKCRAPPKPGDPECKPSCRCADGYYRNKQGVCVPENECLTCSGQNEVIGCQNTCSPQTCESIGKRYNCPLQPAICRPECRCKKDFFRNKIGQCISKENCLKCTGPNEYFSCGGACDNVCATLATQNQTNCPIVNVVCNPKCYCEQGYARDSNNTCVLISQCPQPICGQNEVFDECPATCPPRTCVAMGREYKCRAPPKLGDPECKPSCRCADGYYRNKQDVCVPKNKCPKPVVCGADEVYDSCVNGGCRRWNCSQPGIICIDLIKGGCREGCRCKEDLLRTDDGVCVPADQCPINCFGQNEIRGCRLNCPPQTCESIGKEYCCPPQTKECREECRCKEGFFRNKINECISKEDCLKCTGPNEYFSCGGACDNVCATLATQNQTNCPIDNVVCNPKCYCVQGYARDSNNICVLISKCPQPPTCGTNEVYDTCPPMCPTQRCDFDPRVSLCAPNPQPGDSQCKPGCRCIDDYLRNNLNQCIPRDQCDNNNTKNELEFERGNVVFTLKFLCEAANANPGVSLIFSPFSVLFLLAQLALYATGALLEQLLRILNLDTQHKIRNAIPNYLDTLGSQRNITLDLTAKTYSNNKYLLSSGFKRDTREIFKAEAQNLDFSKPNEAADIINAWVKQQTNNLIKDLVQPSSLGGDTAFVLVNAIYFKGDWKNKFDPMNTRKKDFYVDNNKIVQVDMMSRTGTYKYAEINNLGAQVIQLPYESDNFSFMIYLPITKDGINDLVDKLCDSNFSFNNIFNNLRYVQTDVSIPAFNITTTTDLKEILIKTNLPALFDPKIASFNGILENPQPIYVSSATQKATVIVNESGSIAAAANAVIVGVTAVQQRTTFIANHPFIYFILYKETPIFCGIYFGSV